MLRKTKKEWEKQLWSDLKIKLYFYKTIRLDNNKKYKVSPFFFASEDIKEDRFLNVLAYASGAQDIEIKKEFLEETKFLLEVIDITDKKLLYHLNKDFFNNEDDKEFITKYLGQVYNQNEKINWKLNKDLLQDEEFINKCLKINNQGFNLFLFKEYLKTKPESKEIIEYGKEYPYLIHVMSSKIKKYFFNEERETFFKYMESGYESYKKLPTELKLNPEIINKALKNSKFNAFDIPTEIKTLENIKYWYEAGYPLGSIPKEYFKDKELVEKILLNGGMMKFFIGKNINEVYENFDYMALALKTYPHLDLLEKIENKEMKNNLINITLYHQKNHSLNATELKKQWFWLREWNAEKEQIKKFLKNNKFVMDILDEVAPHLDENIKDFCDYIKTNGYVYIYAKRNKKNWSVIKSYLEFYSPDVFGKDKFLPQEIITEFNRHNVQLNITEMLNYANYKLLNEQLSKKESGKKLKI